MINIFQPMLGSQELYAVQQVLRSNWIGRGKKVDAFEEAWAKHVGVPRENIMSITSATEGLFQIMKLIGATKGTEVIMPSISFVGAANAVAARGGRVVLCDVEEGTPNPTAELIAKKITARTIAVIVLHYGGVPPRDLAEIAALCKRKGLFLVEDAACSPAGKAGGVSCGAVGDFGVWSFDAMKVMSTGDGGMIYASDPEFIRELRPETYLGMDQQSGLSSTSDEWWKFEVLVPGRRSIMNDITAAIGLEQLTRLPDFIQKRKVVWDSYNENLAGIPVDLPPPIPDSDVSSYYMYWIQTDKRNELAKYLKGNGVYTTFRYHPLHHTQFYGPDNLPVSDRVSQRCLNLPLHQGLSTDDVWTVITSVRDFFNES